MWSLRDSLKRGKLIGASSLQSKDASRDSETTVALNFYRRAERETHLRSTLTADPLADAGHPSLCPVRVDLSWARREEKRPQVQPNKFHFVVMAFLHSLNPLHRWWQSSLKVHHVNCRLFVYCHLPLLLFSLAVTRVCRIKCVCNLEGAQIISQFAQFC